MENWRPVDGYEGLYAVSDQGRVQRVAPTRGSPTPRILKPALGSHGYLFVTLYRAGVPTPITVHKLVLAAFVGPCPEAHNRNHRDGVKTNNHLGNLEYTTPSANTRHAVAAGLIRGRSMKGTANPRAKITEEQVHLIRRDLASGISPTAIAANRSVPRRAVYSLKYGHTWRHLA